MYERTINRRRARNFPMENFNQNIIKYKAGFLNQAAALGNISKICRITDLSRDARYRYETARNASGVSRCLKSVEITQYKSWMEKTTEPAVIGFVMELPAHRQVRIGNELRKESAFISPSRVAPLGCGTA